MKSPRFFTNQVLLHLAAVVLFLSMPVLFSPDVANALTLFEIPPFQREFITYALLVLFFYASYLFLIPDLFLKRRYVLFVISTIVCVALIMYLPDLIIPRPHMMSPMNMPPMQGPDMRPNHAVKIYFRHGHTLIFSLAILFLAFTLRMNNLYKRTQQEKSEAELSYLKAQINPHFLFNTLNSIYSLAIVKSDLTASAIVKLSGMMRYAISEAHQNYVSLQKEITYITDYIELQKLRIPDSIKIHFTLNGNAVGKQLPPLLLIPFIENAFKFGVNPEIESDIIIHIDVQESYLLLHVRNQKVNEPTEKTGLGISNSQNRLELFYPGKHELFIQNSEQQFMVSLKILFI